MGATGVYVNDTSHATVMSVVREQMTYNNEYNAGEVVKMSRRGNTVYAVIDEKSKVGSPRMMYVCVAHLTIHKDKEVIVKTVPEFSNPGVYGCPRSLTSLAGDDYLQDENAEAASRWRKGVENYHRIEHLYKQAKAGNGTLLIDITGLAAECLYDSEARHWKVSSCENSKYVGWKLDNATARRLAGL